MKKIVLFITGTVFFLSACNDLDLYPLDQGSTESWYVSETQYEMALNDLYRVMFWPMAEDNWSDDYVYRETRSAIISGTLNSENSEVGTFWTNSYKAIARANTVISSLDRGRSNGIAESILLQYEAEARFVRAARYAQLVFAFGDVPYVDSKITVEEAFAIGRTSKEEVIRAIYSDFDFAITNLPVQYSAKLRATKGAALALKARAALYFGDYTMAVEMAKACMDLGIYTLNSDFGQLFRTKNAKEVIFGIPRSVENNISTVFTRDFIPRNLGGWAGFDPSWDLLACYECTDGLPIDESPLFDSHNPFENRDPRCKETIVELGSVFMGVVFDPHPDALQVMNYNTGRMITNNDTRAVAQYASFNGLIWKKGIDETWDDNGYYVDPDYVVIRYADVLLIYAEAKIELNQIDQSVLDVINTVRARAYGVDKSAVSDYPAVTTMNQTELRKKIRLERRMEFAHEGLRYYDIIRWRIAEVLNNQNCGLLYPASLLREKVVNPGLWFWPSTPQIDDELGMADFSEMINNEQIQVLSVGAWNDRQYLWPIPSKEIVINENMKQNPGY